MKHNPLAGFTLRGHSSGSPRPPMVVRIIERLDKLPFKHVLTRVELNTAIGRHFNDSTVSISVALKDMQPYRVRYGKGYLYGNKKTIAELKRRLKQE